MGAKPKASAENVVKRGARLGSGKRVQTKYKREDKHVYVCRVPYSYRKEDEKGTQKHLHEPAADQMRWSLSFEPVTQRLQC